MKQALHWLCQQPTPYNDHLFNTVAALDDVDLTVHYISGGLASHPWKSRTPVHYRSRVLESTAGIDLELLAKARPGRPAFFILGSWNHPTAVALLASLMLTGGGYAIWTDTPNVERRRGPVKRVLRERWLRRVFRNARWVMGTGRLALETLTGMGCPPDKLVNLPYIIDTDRYQAPERAPGAASGAGHPLVILSSGRLVNADKGYDQALRALAAVRERLPGVQFRYDIAGTGADRDALERLAAELGLGDHVRFLGWLEQDQLAAFYQGGDVYLHPAPFEPYGVTLVEAMASGLVVVASDRTGAAVDRIEDGRNGFLHRANDLESLTETLVRVLSHPEDHARLAREAAASARAWSASRATRVVTEVVHAAC